MSFRTIIASVGLIASAGHAHAAAAQSALAASLDSVAEQAMQTGRVAGMTILVVHKTDTLLHRQYGFADAIAKSRTPVDAVYEIGSVTKQFTSAAIMQLVANGKLRLDDDITRMLPGYDTQGNRVTIGQLLDHTSGIASYTSLPGFAELSTRSGSRDSLVRVFSRAPFTFAPSAAMLYNNSGYFLLGLIIERVTGMTYAEYVATHLFSPAGMRASSYCNRKAPARNAVRGHMFGARGLELVPYIDHTWPFAAGALCSTASDLVRWTAAIHSGKILGNAEYREWLTPATLSNGYRLRYAKGIAVDSVLGHRAAHHGGDIDGFSCELLHFPDDSLTIVVLMNTLTNVRPNTLAAALAARVISRRLSPPRQIGGTPSEYAGAYVPQYGSGIPITVRADKATGDITVQQNTGNILRPVWIAEDLAELGVNRYAFRRTNGAVTTLIHDLVFSVMPLRRQ